MTIGKFWSSRPWTDDPHLQLGDPRSNRFERVSDPSSNFAIRLVAHAFVSHWGHGVDESEPVPHVLQGEPSLQIQSTIILWV
ncbi:MAG: hypothetical protein LBJ75_01050 [Puniceicoccales bacterium]|nr:hypothetical protein [Puniceicoccales bacterium]